MDPGTAQDAARITPAEIAALRQRTGRTKQQEQELAALVDLEAELKDFREELLRIAKFWKPNLNDGVQITAAPPSAAPS